MGFTLTTPCRLASRPNHAPASIATPKTHGRHFSCRFKNAYRGSRLKERGHRFYSAILARWLSRDPMEEFFGPNLYLALENSPINVIDPVGLYKWESDNCTLVITKGDSLSGISEKTGIPLDELKKHFKDPNKIKIGDKIKLDDVSYKVSIHFTGYCSCKKCCGKDPSDPGYGMCKDKTKACEGTLASDPKVIPMGSSVSFTLDGKPFDGTVHDVGGAIKGKEIDVWCAEHADAFKINFTAEATVTIKCKK